MATRKKPKVEKEDLPCCEQCRAGSFQPGENEGECRFLPMQWVYAGDGTTVARVSPAVRGSWCAQFVRRTH